jgi:drug/metabolite transporter (DMT)-like permease
MRDLPAGTASALGIVEPMAATVYSILFLGERLAVLSLIGIVLILGAVFMLGYAENGSGKESAKNSPSEKNDEKI